MLVQFWYNNANKVAQSIDRFVRMNLTKREEETRTLLTKLWSRT